MVLRKFSERVGLCCLTYLCAFSSPVLVTGEENSSTERVRYVPTSCSSDWLEFFVLVSLGFHLISANRSLSTLGSYPGFSNFFFKAVETLT